MTPPDADDRLLFHVALHPLHHFAWRQSQAKKSVRSIWSVQRGWNQRNVDNLQVGGASKSRIIFVSGDHFHNAISVWGRLAYGIDGS